MVHNYIEQEDYLSCFQQLQLEKQRPTLLDTSMALIQQMIVSQETYCL